MDIEPSVNRVRGARPILDPKAVKDPIGSVFQAIEQDFRKGAFAWVGDWREFALGYVTFASILHAHNDSHARPVGSFVVGETSTGKTQFLEALCELLPPDQIIHLTSASAKSLIYECREDPRRLNGKVVFVEELTGLKNPEIQYLLRVLVTKGKATHTTVMAGANEKIDIEGSISLQSTGLPTDSLRDDTMNRMVLFRSDQSQQTTQRVIEDIKSRYLGSLFDRDHCLERYRSFFSGLRPYPVRIPYIDQIHFDTKAHENRRAAKIFMDLLSTVALLNQRDREMDGEFLVSTKDDLDLLLNLSAVQTDAQGDLSLSQIRVLAAATHAKDETFTYQDLADTLAKDHGADYEISSIKKAVTRLRELRLIEVAVQGRPVHFRLARRRCQNRFGVMAAPL